MRFEVSGVDPASGEERTLLTDVADEREARVRAAAHGLSVISVRPEGAPAPARSGSRWSLAGSVASLAFALLAVSASALRLARSCSPDPPEHRLTPEQQQFIEERMRPKLPDWAEDARRQADDAFEEVRRAKATQSATRPTSTPGGIEEWRREPGGQWRRVR